MPFSERSGDMFAADDLDAIAHGVNCVGVMGGIAGMVANKYPEMANHYKQVCKNDGLKTGQVLPWKEDGKPAVYNLATQQNPGADAQYGHIKKSMKIMVKHAERNGINSIGVPQIGCGIGGLEWDKVREIIKKVSDRSPVNVIAYTYEPPKRNISSAWFNS